MKPPVTLYGEAPAHIVISTCTAKSPTPYSSKGMYRESEIRTPEIDGYVRTATSAHKRITMETYELILVLYKELGSYEKVGIQVNRSKHFIKELVVYGVRPIDLIGYRADE